MIYIPATNTCIIHIPRTGGTSFAESVRDDPDCLVYCDCAEAEHMTAGGARQLFPECQTVAVVRNSWDTMRSYYGWCALVDDCEFCDKESMRLRSRRHYPWDQFVLSCCTQDWLGIAQHGGFWKLFCLPDTQIFLYHYHVNEELMASLCVGGQVPSRLGNTSHYGSVTWTTQLIEAVRQYFHVDIEKFGFQPPECGEMTSTGDT